MPPSSGYLYYDPVTGKRREAWAAVNQDVLDVWTKNEQKIAQVEITAPLLAVSCEMKKFAGEDIVSFVDNTPGLSAAMKGASKVWDMDKAAQVLQILLARVGARIWMEYVESKSNWADGISRKLGEDPWVRKHGFTTREEQVPVWPWVTPMRDILMVAGLPSVAQTG